jgi:hypothetical protein
MKGKFRLIASAMVMLLALIGGLIALGRWMVLQFNTRYTIGETTAYHLTRRHSNVDYEYEVNNKHYYNSSRKYGDIKNPWWVLFGKI